MRTPRSVAASYHESTKYAPETMGQIPGADFGAQPVPFKQYHTDRAIDLISYLPPELFPEVTEADG